MGWGQAGVSGTVCLRGGPPRPLGQVVRGDSRAQSLGTQHTKGFCVAELQAPFTDRLAAPGLSHYPTPQLGKVHLRVTRASPGTLEPRLNSFSLSA